MQSGHLAEQTELPPPAALVDLLPVEPEPDLLAGTDEGEPVCDYEDVILRSVN